MTQLRLRKEIPLETKNNKNISEENLTEKVDYKEMYEQLSSNYESLVERYNRVFKLFAKITDIYIGNE